MQNQSTKKNNPPQRNYIMVTMTPEITQAVKDEAEKQGRSASNLCALFIKRGMDELEAQA